MFLPKFVSQVHPELMRGFREAGTSTHINHTFEAFVIRSGVPHYANLRVSLLLYMGNLAYVAIIKLIKQRYPFFLFDKNGDIHESSFPPSFQRTTSNIFKIVPRKVNESSALPLNNVVHRIHFGGRRVKLRLE